jgi:hypothetical protein
VWAWGGWRNTHSGGSVAKGPYQLDDLLNHGINEKDLIWSMNLGVSKYAFEIDELRGYFRKRKNKNKLSHKHTIALQKPSATSIKKAILFSLLFILAGMVGYYFTV